MRRFASAAIVLAIALVSVGFVTPASAIVISTTDRATWEAAVGGTFIEDTFPAPIAQDFSITFASGVVSTVSTCCGNATINVVRDPPGASDNNIKFQHILGPNGSPDLTWAFPMPVTGFGVDWSGVDNVEVVVLGQTFDINALLGGKTGFVGFVSTTAFSSFAFNNPTPSGSDFFGADNLVFAKAASVFEPTTLILFGFGLFGLGFALRRGQWVQRSEPVR